MLFRAGFGRLLFLLAAYPSAVDALAFRVSSARPALGAPLALRATSEHSVDVSRNETAVAAPMPKKKGVLARLGEGGLATLTAYGLINTAFYNVGLVVVMLGAQGVAGEGAGMKRLLKCLAIVWAFGQFIKAPKAAAAIALSPGVDRVLRRIQDRLGMQRKLFAAGILTLGMASVFAVTWTLLLFGEALPLG